MLWTEIVETSKNIAELANELKIKGGGDLYPNSIQVLNNQLFFLAKANLEQKLIIITEDTVSDFQGSETKLGGFTVLEGDLNNHNATQLRNLFPWTKPQAFGGKGVSLGLGDRLGLASQGHLASIEGTNIKPVLAQQSMRELNLTNRSYADVLDAATFAVFQVDYQGGFGADGDHLKTTEDIKDALALGFSMITLDCSEHISNEVQDLSDDQVRTEYLKLDVELRQYLEEKYLQRTHKLKSGKEISFAQASFFRMILVYLDALDFAEKIYNELIKPLEREVDFEISIDEVAIPTTPQDHYFFASELKARGVKVCGIAPRFCGAFEKGIDYAGDLEQFKADFIIHAEIAEHYEYKVSVHSGSDKFSIFPIVGKYSNKRLHVKTAGTNWLEALRVIAKVKPSLFRELYELGLANLEGARKYYVVTLDVTELPDLNTLSDQDLPNLLEQRDVRQALHITYGFILQEPRLKGAIYKTLREHESEYALALETHLKKHIETLGFS